MRLRTALTLPRRSLALELSLAVATAFTVAINAWAPGNQELSKPLVVTGAAVFAFVVFLLRRSAPVVPFLVAAALVALSPKVIGLALPAAAYAVGRYTGRWPVRVAAAVVGSLALARFGFLPLGDVPGALGSIAVALLLPGAVGAYVRTRAELMTALQERAERAEAERELLARDAVLTERTRIAREMHDAVGHRVSLMVLQAGAIEMAAADRDRVEQLAAQVQTAGRQALEELRQAVGVLRSGEEEDDDAPLAPQPGLEDLDRLVAEWRAAGMAVTLRRTPSDTASIEAAISRAAYRIAQEALTNAGRHAPGAPVTVDVERPTGCVVVRVVNGPGRPADSDPGGGFGLIGLRERVRTLHGRLRTEPRLDGGFLVEAELPA